MATTRTIKSLDEISEWMTQELASVQDCAGSRMRAQYPLAEPDKDGCNWSDSVVLNAGPNITLELLSPIATKVVAAARERFNLPG